MLSERAVVMFSRLGGQLAQMHGQDGAGKTPLALGAGGPPDPCCGVQDMPVPTKELQILLTCAVHVLQGYAAQRGSTRSTRQGGAAEERKPKLVSTRGGDLMLTLLGCYLTLSKVIPLLPRLFSTPGSILCPQESI